MAAVIRSPEVAETARILPSKATAAEKPQLAKDNVFHEEQQIRDLPNEVSETPLRKVTRDEVEQVYNQYKLEEHEMHAQPDANYEEVLKYRVQIQQLEQKLTALNQSIEEKKSNAVEEGFQQGYEEGEAAALEKHAETLQTMQELLNSLQANSNSIIASQEDVMVEVVAAAVGKMVADIYVTQEGTIAAVKSAIKQISQREKLIFRISPDDYEILNENKQKLLTGLEDKSVEFIADENVKHGGCILENSAGSIDKRLDIQMQSFLDTMARVRKQKRMAEQ